MFAQRTALNPRYILFGLLLLQSLALPDRASADDAGWPVLSRQAAQARAAALEALGRKLFFDPSLSGSGRLACSSCHDPGHAFGPPNARDVQLGGKDLRQPGLRAVPSLRYLQTAPQFAEHYFDSDDEGDASVDNGPTGGLTWDGRADRARDQAPTPLLSPFEMSNESSLALIEKLRNTEYDATLRGLFGPSIFYNSTRTLAAIGEALEAYQQNASEFYPYSSRYDRYLSGKGRLSDQQMRGLKLFNDPQKGNCGNCHRSKVAGDGTPPQFTDYGFIALGLPRNRDLPSNADPAYFDLGLCGPLRTDLSGRREYCGLFRAPTLRNVALRKTFFHNGAAHSLRAAVAFYVERDTKPERWYPRNSRGQVLKFDDLPARYRINVNTEPPFGRQPDNLPVLSDSEIDDIVAFLETLTDQDVAP